MSSFNLGNLSLDERERENDTLSDELESTFDKIVKSCPRFRILLLGRSGVGKSALINAVFGSDVVKEEHSITPGVSDINEEIILPNNPRIVLHDSQGFSHGDGSNFETVMAFIRKRESEKDLKDRLHAIWLCLEIPAYGSSLLEVAEEKILETKGIEVPIVVAITKYDKLVNKIRREMPREALKGLKAEEIDSAARKQAEARFNAMHTGAFDKIREAKIPFVKVSNKPKFRDTRDELIEVTEQRVKGNLWFIWASAQRPNVDIKIKASIEVGRRNYWRGLSSSLSIPGLSMAKLLNVIHADIVNPWGFHDPNALLKSKMLRNRMSELQADLATEGVGRLPRNISLGAVSTAATVISGLIPPAAPFAIPIAAGLVFASWVYNVIKTTPQVLRGLMGYIVDLTIVMQSLFWLTQARAQAVSKETSTATVPLSKRLVELAFKAYATDGQSKSVHEEIWAFVKPTIVLKQEVVFEKIVQLIEANRFKPPESFQVEARNVADSSSEDLDWEGGS